MQKTCELEQAGESALGEKSVSASKGHRMPVAQTPIRLWTVCGVVYHSSVRRSTTGSGRLPSVDPLQNRDKCSKLGRCALIFEVIDSGPSFTEPVIPTQRASSQFLPGAATSRR